MSWHKQQPPGPPYEGDGALLIRAIGDLQGENEGEPVAEMDVLAAAIGRELTDLPALINRGIDAGFIEEDINGAVQLTRRGLAWWIHDADR